jgi:hypothetical protein
MGMDSMNAVVLDTRQNPGCRVQLARFALIGWRFL